MNNCDVIKLFNCLQFVSSCLRFVGTWSLLHELRLWLRQPLDIFPKSGNLIIVDMGKVDHMTVFGGKHAFTVLWGHMTGNDAHIIAAITPSQDFFCVFDHNGQAGSRQNRVKGNRFQWAVFSSYMEIVACFRQPFIVFLLTDFSQPKLIAEAFSIVAHKQIHMGAVAAGNDFPGMSTAATAKEPSIPCGGIIKINAGTSIQAISCAGKSFIPAICVSKIEFIGCAIGAIIAQRSIAQFAGVEEIVGSE